MMKRIRIMIADDHAILRAGLRSLLSAQNDMEIVAEAVDGQDAIEKATQTQPDILLMDLSMPKCSGIDATAQVRKLSPLTRVLVLTMHDDQAYLHSVLAAGGAGYLVKRAADSELLAAIRALAQGRAYIDIGLGGDSQLQQVLKNPKNTDSRCTPHCTTPLSERELQVLGSVALGYTHKEIADQLHVSVKTVETYRARLADKLGLRSRAQLVQFALECGLLDTKRTRPQPPEPSNEVQSSL